MPAAKSRHAIENVPALTARRMLLKAQGLLDDPTRRATVASLGKLIEQMGFVQIDTISTIERAHHLTLCSRLDSYRPEMLAALLEKKRDLFEHWTHDASAIPSKWFPHWRHRFERSRARIRANAWWKQRIGENADQIIDQVLERITKDGPLLSRDFEHERPENDTAGWWGWKPQKAALEYLWRCGELTVAKRINFQKVYDLTHRVLPELAALPASQPHEHIEWACSSALERLGMATPGELAAFWHDISPAQARSWCIEARKAGRIVELNVEAADGSKPRKAFAFSDWKKTAARLPEPADDRIRLLSPFDPVIRDRKRAQRLFNFDYTFEAFVPGPKRRYGYYVLPMLQGDQLIGRLDPKLHRERGVVEIKGLWWEPKIKATPARRAMLNEAVERLAAFVGAQRVEWSTRRG